MSKSWERKESGKDKLVNGKQVRQDESNVRAEVFFSKINKKYRRVIINGSGSKACGPSIFGSNIIWFFQDLLNLSKKKIIILQLEKKLQMKLWENTLTSSRYKKPWNFETERYFSFMSLKDILVLANKMCNLQKRCS